MQLKHLITITSVILIFNFKILIAQDRHFAWTYESITLPKGSIDIEPWVTIKSGKKNYYNRLEARFEFELGLTDKLQTALYFNSKHKAAAIADTANYILGFAKESEFSFSNEWKLNLLNPSIAPIGLGLYGEFTISANEIELEGKILLDKKTEKNIFAYNIVGEYEMEYGYELNKSGKGEIEMEKKLKIENDLSYMRMFQPNFGLGLEIRNHNIIEESELEHSALFAGPTLFYSRQNEKGSGYFIIFNVQPQLISLKGSDALDLDEYEKINARILLGLSF